MRSFATLVSLLALVGQVFANSGTYTFPAPWTGTNPSNVSFGLYLPPTVVANAPVVVMVHWCSGSAQDAYGYSPYPAIADIYGFPVIFPDSPNTGAAKCWDVGSNATLTHNGGGDSLSIINFIKYVIQKYNCDASRVYVTGISSGAMMTEVLAGAYPDVIAAGAEVAGVPFGCWANGGVAVWNSDCANGLVTKTGAEWAQLVQNAYPGYTGKRPKLQLYHGTLDTTVNYINHGEAIKQWTSVFGISETPTETVTDSPSVGWTKTVYGTSGQLEAYSQKDATHATVSYEVGQMVTFFGLTSTTTPTTTTVTPAPTTAPATTMPATTAPTTTQTPTTAPATPTATPSSTVPQWGQCGGIGYTGSKTCASGLTCKVFNDWYSQCL